VTLAGALLPAELRQGGAQRSAGDLYDAGIGEVTRRCIVEACSDSSAADMCVLANMFVNRHFCLRGPTGLQDGRITLHPSQPSARRVYPHSGLP
jgi:hypothetical protein